MEKKNKGLLQSYRRYILFPAILVAIVLVAVITFSIVYAFTNSLVVIIIFSVFAVATFVGYVLLYRHMNTKLTKTFYSQLYLTTYENLRKINENVTSLTPYGDSDIKEIQTLSQITSDVQTKLQSSFLIVDSADYSNINLEYVNGQTDLVTFKSLRQNLSNIILVSQAFRNILIDVYFDLPDDTEWTPADKDRLLALYREVFQEHEHVLFAFRENEPSLLIYVPNIDSFQEIKEKLNYAVTSSSVMVRDAVGIRNILARYAIVAYPYSTEEMMMGDLRFAKSKKQPYYLYLPRRFKSNVDTGLLMNTSMVLNYSSKTLDILSQLDYSATDNDKNDNLLRTVFDNIVDFMNYDEAGIITYNAAMDRYDPYIATKRSTLFKNQAIPKDFAETLASYIDDDNLYYFSMRKHANMGLQEMLGFYGIQSGIYYVVRNFEDNKVAAIIYIFNRDKDMRMNSYMRETFLMVALRIENYFEKQAVVDYADVKDTENQNILALNSMFVYHVDDENNITYLSKGFRKLFPKAKVGERCHEAFFGLERRCPNCPLATRKKMYLDRKNDKYEISIILADRRDDNHTMLIRRVEDDGSYGDLFQDDFLIYSYKSLVTAIRNEYHAGARGYTVILAIDNANELLAKLGAEGYNFLMRDYIRNLKNKLATEDVYFYNPTALAIHLPFVGHKDIINKIEDIYPLSKADYYNNDGFGMLNITYLPVGYPRGYAHAEDYLKHVSDFYRNTSLARNRDFIYFADFSIERSASKREFMISVLESEFSGHNSTSMNLQPIVHAKTGHIYGAEILLRIADAHRDVFFNAMEISRIAEQEHKTGMITDSIINFIGNMYKEYGNNVFKINKFNRIAINIDQTYLGNDDMVKNLIALSEENALPSGFISLEIPEDLIPENKEKIKTLAKTLSKYQIMFSCDRYTHQYTSIEDLAELGFNEVKIARDIILKIDKDQAKLHETIEIIETAKKSKISIAAVGVETKQQFELLRELDEDMMVQGYYLYKPLTRADLIRALMSYEG